MLNLGVTYNNFYVSCLSIEITRRNELFGHELRDFEVYRALMFIITKVYAFIKLEDYEENMGNL